MILLLCTLGLGYACYNSIYSDIAFSEERAAREKLVIARLTQIRDAEEAYKKTYGDYVGTMDSLIDFIKNGRAVKDIKKDGVFTDELSEKFQGDENAAIRAGAIKVDTIWMSTAEMLGITNPDSLKYVPVGRPADGTKVTVASTFDPSQTVEVYQGIIQLRKKAEFNLKQNQFDMLVEFRANMDDYLDGMDAKKIKNLKADLKKLGRNRAELMLDNEDDTEGEWFGLRMGDLKDPGNKMAGNWE